MEENKAFISVIITAYNRKNYIKDAVGSVLNQTLDRNKYEVILIKNFRTELDSKWKKKGIKLLFIKDGTNGEFLAKAISAAKGTVITFLEDDDVYFKSRLDHVLSLFKQDEQLVYYHNNVQSINDNGKPINKEYNHPWHNLSSIAVKKDIINLTALKKMEAVVPDLFMYLSALESGGHMILDNKKLTYFRFHNSTSNPIESNYKNYKQRIMNKQIKYITQFNHFLSFFKDRRAVSLIKSLIFLNNLLLFSYDKKYKPRYFITFLLYYRYYGGLISRLHEDVFNNKLFATFEYLSLLLFGDFARRILERKRVERYKIQYSNWINLATLK